MVCKFCGNEIPDGSIFCNFCGERQVKQRKKKDEIKVPKPVQLKSGAWNIYLRAEGQSVTEATPDLCITKAKAVRAGFLEEKKKAPKVTLDAAMKKYIDENSEVLSPSTIEGYKKIHRCNFKKYLQCDINTIPWQEAINEEAKHLSPKTVRNAWGFAVPVMKSIGITPPDVNIPAKVKNELAWLDYEQIVTFLDVIRDDSCELAALLALHSLRRSELYAITPSKIVGDEICVDGASLIIEGEKINKKSNKTTNSKRNVPIVIPRLQQLLSSSDAGADDPYVTLHPNVVYRHINAACARAGLPEVGFHGLRRSFCSLAFHLGWPIEITMEVGGWDNYETVRKHYLKLSKKDLASATKKMRKFYEKNDATSKKKRPHKSPAA